MPPFVVGGEGEAEAGVTWNAAATPTQRDLAARVTQKHRRDSGQRTMTQRDQNCQSRWLPGDRRSTEQLEA